MKLAQSIDYGNFVMVMFPSLPVDFVQMRPKTAQKQTHKTTNIVTIRTTIGRYLRQDMYLVLNNLLPETHSAMNYEIYIHWHATF